MTARSRFPALVAAALAAALPAAAETSGEIRSLTLEQAIETALANNPSLRQSAIAISAAETRVRQARAGLLPQIDAGGLANQGLTGSANLFDLHGLASSPEPRSGAFSVNVLQDVLDFKRSRFESRARRAEVEYFEQTLRADRARLVLEVQRAYFDGLKANRQLSPASELVKQRDLEQTRADALLEAELGTKVEADQARLRASEAQLGLTTAAETERKALASLSTVMGEETPSRFQLQEPEISEHGPDALESLLASAVENRAELAAVDARIEAAQEWVRRAEREKYPRMMVMFSGGWTRFAELTLGRLLFGAFGLRLPLFTGGRLEAVIDETKLAVDKTEAMREELEQAIQLEVATAHSQAVATLEAVGAARLALEQARAVATLADLRHQQGLSSRLDVVIARTELVAAENGFHQARYDHARATAELGFASGPASP